MALPARLDRREIAGKPKVRSPAHRDWVRSHRCCVPGCQLMPIEVAHIRRAANSGKGFKPSDAFTCSLCMEHHAESHRGERTFERKHGLDLMALAKEFYERSPFRNRLENPYG